MSCFMSVSAVEGIEGVQLAMPVVTWLGGSSSNLARCSTYALDGIAVTFLAETGRNHFLEAA